MLRSISPQDTTRRDISRLARSRSEKRTPSRTRRRAPSGSEARPISPVPASSAMRPEGAVWIVGSGDTGRSHIFSYTADGAVWLVGAADTLRCRSLSYEADGGIWIIGSAELSHGKAYEGSGAIWLAGAADLEFLRGIPRPLLIKAVIIGQRAGAVGWAGMAGTITVDGVGPRADMLGKQLAELSISADGLRAMIRGWSKIAAAIEGSGASSRITGSGPTASLN